MKTKSLAAKNRYLKKGTSGKMIAQNLASSTSVETGKSASIYIKRYAATRTMKDGSIHSLKPVAATPLKPQKKSAS